jgi:hypothetical protein
MVIVAGHITVEPQQRESYLTGWVSIAEQARRAAGCLDFAISADLLDPGPHQHLRALGVSILRPGTTVALAASGAKLFTSPFRSSESDPRGATATAALAK